MSAKRHSIDWEAVERDYRAGAYSLRELEAKHGVGYAQISKRAKKQGWLKDLRKAIRAATDAAIVKETVAQAQQDTTLSVLAVAEANKIIIFKHREDIEATRVVARDLLEEVRNARLLAEEQEMIASFLAGESATPAQEAQIRQTVRKALDFGNRVSSVKLLADTIAKLQDCERRSYNLDDQEPERPQQTPPVLISPGMMADPEAWSKAAGG